jgi:catechol 2,3-dioxygenase-like lactoylglutathione lyase family enzyme
MTAASFKLDHVVILVKDLSAAIEEYSGLGFTVLLGGEHQGGLSHNALIPFVDGTYLELIAFKSPGAGGAQQAHTDSGMLSGLWGRFQHRRALGQGLVDFAFSSASVADDIQRCSLRGLDLTGPTAGGRVRPDGRELSWLTALPPSFDLPFLIQDQTPRGLRVPSGTAADHLNGAKGIIKITIAVNDLSTSRQRYDALTGAASIAGSFQKASETSNADYHIENAIVTLLAGNTTAEIRQCLGSDSDRPYCVELLTDNPGYRGLLGLSSQGARILLTTAV